MALKDFQSIRVTPGNEDEEVRVWMSFGWELKNKQRVKTQDAQRLTGRSSDGTEYYETTEGVDFFELTFERDPERKNYAELKSLEAQYYAPLPRFHATFPEKPKEPSKPGVQPQKPGVFHLIRNVVGVLLGALLVVTGIYGFATGRRGDIIYSIIIFVLGVILAGAGVAALMSRKSFSSRLKSWEEEVKSYPSRLESLENAWIERVKSYNKQQEPLIEAQKKRADALEKAKSLV